MKIIVAVKGGPTSGNYGHSGRPGLVGGSGGTGGVSSAVKVIGSDPRRVEFAKKSLASFSEKAQRTVDAIVLDDTPGEQFIAGGQVFTEGGNWFAPTKTITIHSNISVVSITLEHEMAHAIYSDLVDKTSAINPTEMRLRYLWESAVASGEGGVTDYGKAWGTPSEIFAGMYEMYRAHINSGSSLDAAAMLVGIDAKNVGCPRLGLVFPEMVGLYED